MDKDKKNLTQEQIDDIFSTVNKLDKLEKRRPKRKKLSEEELKRLEDEVERMEFDAESFAQEIFYVLGLYYKGIKFKVDDNVLTCLTYAGEKFLITVERLK